MNNLDYIKFSNLYDDIEKEKNNHTIIYDFKEYLNEFHNKDIIKNY